MAENKKRVVVYADWIDKFEELEDDEAGRLAKHFWRYINDLNPVAPDRITKLSFIDIEKQLKRDLVKWEEVIESKKRAGKASAEAKKIKKEHNSTQSTHVDYVAENSTQSTVKDKDTVIIDTVKDKEIINILNNSLLSEIKISEDNFIYFKDFIFKCSDSFRINFKTAVWFQKLFIKNLKEKDSPTSTQEKATYKNYVTPIRLMFDVDMVTKDQIKTAYEFLDSIDGEFWKKNILSTEALRKQIQKLTIQKNTTNGKQFASTSKKPARFSVARAAETIRTDAERKQR